MGVFKQFWQFFSGGPSFAEIEAEARALQANLRRRRTGELSPEEVEAIRIVCGTDRWTWAEKAKLLKALKMYGEPGARRFLAAVGDSAYLTAEELSQRRRQDTLALAALVIGIPLMGELFEKR